MQEDQQYLTVSETAQLLKMSIRAVYRALKAGQLEQKRIGRRIRVKL